MLNIGVTQINESSVVMFNKILRVQRNPETKSLRTTDLANIPKIFI